MNPCVGVVVGGVVVRGGMLGLRLYAPLPEAPEDDGPGYGAAM